MLENGGYIRCQELLTLSNANDQRTTAIACTNEQVRLLGTGNGNSIRAADALQGKTHCLLKVVLRITEVVALDKV